MRLEHEVEKETWLLNVFPIRSILFSELSLCEICIVK